LEARYASSTWQVRIDPDHSNGLTKPSAVDALQLRGLDYQRFVQKLGEASPSHLDEIAFAVATVIEDP
jgi:mRNA interferase MazF